MERWLSRNARRERRKLIKHLIDQKGFTALQVARRMGADYNNVKYDYNKESQRPKPAAPLSD